jgi:hypothetical protein
MREPYIYATKGGTQTCWTLGAEIGVLDPTNADILVHKPHICFLVHTEAESRHTSAMVLPLISTCFRHKTYSVPGGKVDILGGHSTGHSKQKTVYVHVSYSERFPR